MSIKENLNVINAKITEAAIKSGRSPKDITLVGVTKTIEVAQIRECMFGNLLVFGENKVQEFLPKYEILAQETPQPRWHFIGHLQKNKVKFIIDKVDLIHSVDSLALAAEINKRAIASNKMANILAEINIAQESSKFGFSPSQILEFAKNLENMQGVRLKGFMCVPPFVENPEENRQFFIKMRNLLLDIKEKGLYHIDLQELSMGMSGDYGVAVEEGATMVRVGTSLFGSRII